MREIEGREKGRNRGNERKEGKKVRNS